MTKNLPHIALFAALITVLFVLPSAMLSVGVPISATSLGIMLSGTILGARRGGLAALLFIVLVAVGAPSLFGAVSGVGLFVGPRAGFLLAFPIAAFVTGLIVEKWRGNLTVVSLTAAFVGGVVVLYAIGIPVMTAMLSAERVTTMFQDLPLYGRLPLPLALSALFLPGDLIKCVLAALITRAVAQMRPGALLSRA